MRGFAAVLLSLTVLMAGCSSPGDDAETAARDAIDEAYAAFNSGDVDAWVDARDRGSYYATEEDRDRAMTTMRATIGAAMDAGAQYQDVACDSLGHGDWPVADTGEVTGYYFTCETVLVQDGRELPENFEWVVEGGEVVAVRSDR